MSELTACLMKHKILNVRPFGEKSLLTPDLESATFVWELPIYLLNPLRPLSPAIYRPLSKARLMAKGKDSSQKQDGRLPQCHSSVLAKITLPALPHKL